MACRVGATGGHNGDQPVTDSAQVTRGRQPAVRPLVRRRSCQPKCVRVPQASRSLGRA